MKTRKNETARARGDCQGMNWIRQDKRLAIYIRDGFACGWCGHSVEDGASLQIDHLKPHSKGGSNHESNLVTCCERCNKSRGNRSVSAFARAVAKYLNHGIKTDDILRHVRRTSARKLPREEAKRMIARRGSAAKVLASL